MGTSSDLGESFATSYAKPEVVALGDAKLPLPRLGGRPAWSLTASPVHIPSRQPTTWTIRNTGGNTGMVGALSSDHPGDSGKSATALGRE